MARGKVGDAKIQERIVSGRDVMVCVREQPETETFFRAKLLVGGLVLHAYTEDDRVFLFILPEVALEIVRFLGATTGEILGIEIEHDPFAAKIVQPNRFAILRIQCEVRRGRPRGWGFFSITNPAAHTHSTS